MNDTIISWNISNWITIVLMAAIGFALLGVAEKMVLKSRNQGS